MSFATHCNTLQHTAAHCNTLQHTATHCNTLQHSATELQQYIQFTALWNTYHGSDLHRVGKMHCCVLQCVAVCCSARQCVAVCCSVLQCAVVCCKLLPRAAMCCRVSQHRNATVLPSKCHSIATLNARPRGAIRADSRRVGTMRCSVAVCYSVLQCVAVCQRLN